MEVRKRTWTTANGKRKTAFFMDYVHPLTGQRVRETLNASNKSTADLFAAARYERICREAELGKSAGPTDEQKGVVLKDFLEHDLERVPLAATTKRMEGHRHKALLRHLGERAAVVDLDYPDFVRYQKQRKKDEWRGCFISSGTVNDELAILRAALNRAYKEGRLWRVPDFPEFLPEEEPKRRFLMPDEVVKLIKALRAQPVSGEADGDIAEVMYCLGGLRPHELWTMTWGDVNLGKRQVTVLSQKIGNSKRARRRTLPISDNLMEIFKRWKAKRDKTGPNDLVFGVRPEDRLSQCSEAKAHGCIDGVEFFGDFDFNGKLKRAAAKAGLDDPDSISGYVLRHSAASNADGSDIVDISYMLGHSSPKTTLEIYRHMHRDRMETGVSSLSRHMEGTKDSATVHDITDIKDVG